VVDTSEKNHKDFSGESFTKKNISQWLKQGQILKSVKYIKGG